MGLSQALRIMMAKLASSGAGAAVAPARTGSPHATIEQRLKNAASAEFVCAEISKIFNVATTEVALLRVEGDALNFLFPPELRSVGSIPLSSAKAVAARTATSRKVELFNHFVIVQHANLFETVKLSTFGQSIAPGANTIQKLMTAPVVDTQERVLGIIQVCHKGLTPDDSGPDFTLGDLHHLEIVSRTIAGLSFMRT